MNLVLSAMAPETMVVAVAQKTTWNIQNARIHGSSPIPEKKKTLVASKPFHAVPNMKANPIVQQAREPIEKSMTFFMMMLAAFLALVKPDSTMANPACMKNTRKAATSVQT
jgi:hypothetical protein